MQVVFQNLISNAMKYCNKDITPVIKIRAETNADSNELNGIDGSNYCRIYVEDNGIGFDQKYAEQIFSMFTRLHNNSEYEGTGIGLALCKKIVEDHKGFISARSKINEGSTFIISLPLDGNETISGKSKVSMSTL
jgi:signal transduction histidine kinase